jgi:polyketide cyclase/dehydrase/lipid transport protein
VRYADGPTTEAEVHVDAPPSAVWPLVSDIQLPGRFSSEFVRGEWLDGGSPGLGARFVGHNHHAAIGDWQTTSTIVEFEPAQRFGWAVGDPGYPAAHWRFELEEEGDGTRLRQWMRLGPAPSGLTPAIERWPDKEERIIDRRLAEHRANMEATIRGIKEIVETGGS